MKLKIKSNLLFASLVFAVLVLDQVTKFFATRFFKVACNSGGAFGVSGNFVLVSAVVLVLVFLIILREKNKLNLAGLALVFGGGISNFLDRMFIGCVRDFVDFRIFPSFNLADSAITLGAVLVFYNLIFGRQSINEP